VLSSSSSKVLNNLNKQVRNSCDISIIILPLCIFFFHLYGSLLAVLPLPPQRTIFLQNADNRITFCRKMGQLFSSFLLLGAHSFLLDCLYNISISISFFPGYLFLFIGQPFVLTAFFNSAHYWIMLVHDLDKRFQTIIFSIFFRIFFARSFSCKNVDFYFLFWNLLRVWYVHPGILDFVYLVHRLPTHEYVYVLKHTPPPWSLYCLQWFILFFILYFY